jgi:3-isopropylmalate/(R)-2-methylmalate dehydratase small subunit
MFDYIIRAKVLGKFGDNVDTNIIAGSLPTMTALDPKFIERMKPGGFLVSGKHFGCGSSRETAPVRLKEANVKAVIAEPTFARIFFRNSINQGLPVIECRGAQRINLGDDLELNIRTAVIKNLTTGETLQGLPLPQFLLERIAAGGVFDHLKQLIQRNAVTVRRYQATQNTHFL